MTADSAIDIQRIRAMGRICAETLRKMMSQTRAGMTTRAWDEDLVLAIEPFLTTAAGRVVQERDNGSLRTSERTMAAQFEHTIVVTRNEPIVLTI